MEKPAVEASPRALARVGGVLYLIMIVVGIFDEAFVKGRIVASESTRSAAATV
jgi:hypothetical protein